MSAWTESHTAVSVSGGVFNVVLGAASALTADDFDLTFAFLGIEVNGTGELAPRQQVVGHWPRPKQILGG